MVGRYGMYILFRGSTLCMYKQVSLSYKPLPAQFQSAGRKVFRGTSHDNLPDCRAPCEEDVVKPLPQQFCSHTHSSGHHLVEILSATHIVYTTYSTVYVHTLVKKSLEKKIRKVFFVNAVSQLKANFHIFCTLQGTKNV